jgi:flagellar protein FliS
LRSSLDMNAGGEIARNLEDLYDYMERRLTAANVESSVEMLDEVASLLKQIKEAWDAIGDPVNTTSSAPAAVTTTVVGG